MKVVIISQMKPSLSNI